MALVFNGTTASGFHDIVSDSGPMMRTRYNEYPPANGAELLTYGESARVIVYYVRFEQTTKDLLQAEELAWMNLRKANTVGTLSARFNASVTNCHFSNMQFIKRYRSSDYFMAEYNLTFTQLEPQ